MKIAQILIVIAVILVLLTVLLAFRLRKLKDENKKLKMKSENYSNSIQKIEENIANANKEKASIHTGDDVNDFSNGLDIMQKCSKKR